jgi:hypothetical protein
VSPASPRRFSALSDRPTAAPTSPRIDSGQKTHKHARLAFLYASGLLEQVLVSCTRLALDLVERRDASERLTGDRCGACGGELKEAAALGARSLANRRPSDPPLAVDEAGTMDVLCADKTGTLTQNALTVTTIHPMAGFDEAHVLALAALASSDGGQDPVDAAIRASAARKTVPDAPKLIRFEPFDPARKMSEATAMDSNGALQRIVKGAFAAVIGLTQPSASDEATAAALEGQADMRACRGYASMSYFRHMYCGALGDNELQGPRSIQSGFLQCGPGHRRNHRLGTGLRAEV